MTDRLARLDALRGAAAAYVVLHHTLPHHVYVAGVNVATPLRFGQEAVMVFFLVSGFVVARSFERRADRAVLPFLGRRALRIYVPLLGALVIAYLTESYNAAQWVDPRWIELLGNLAMLQDNVAVKPHVLVAPYHGNVPLWSLSYEIWFYLLFALVSASIDDERKRDRWVFATMVGAACLHVVWPVFPVRVLLYLGIWWSGVYAYRCHARGELFSWRRFALPIGALGLSCAILCVDVALTLPVTGPRTFAFYPWLALRHVTGALVCLVFGLAWRRSGWIGFRWTLAPFARIAPLSYGLYITHHHLFRSATYLSFIEQPVVRWFGYLTVTLLVSWLLECRLYPAVVRYLARHRGSREPRFAR